MNAEHELYPTKECEPYWKTELGYKDIIIGGLINLVVDIEKDKKGSLLETHQNSLRFIKGFSEEFDLMDTYRNLRFIVMSRNFLTCHITNNTN